LPPPLPLGQAKGPPGPAGPQVDLTLVVVTWNSAELIAACLHSVAGGCGGRSHEVIVVDNASGDGTVGVVASQFPSVRVVTNTANRGFAAACAQGIALASGRQVMLLNPDTVVTAGAIDRLAHAFDDPGVGLAGPRLVLSDGTTQLAAARRMPKLAYVFYAPFRLSRFPRLRRWGDRRVICPYDLSQSQDVEAISGAAMLIRGEVIATLGPLDEAYRHTGEDVDYCLAASRAGWRIRYVHDAEVWHHGGASTAQDPYRVTMDGVLSVDRYYRKNWSTTHARAYRLTIVVCRVPATVVGGLVAVATGRESLGALRSRCRLAWSMIRFVPYRSEAAPTTAE